MSRVIDDFFGEYYFGFLRRWADAQDYTGVVNPVDGVTYPGICTRFPDTEALRDRINRRLTETNNGKAVNVHTLLMRLSVKGTPAPQMVHTDASMGQLTFLLYMNRAADCMGGTSVLVHKTGLSQTPQTDAEVALVLRDQNDLSKWDVVERCRMKPNRAFILPSQLFHLAEPVGGFGKTAEDGRLVLVGFANLEN